MKALRAFPRAAARRIAFVLTDLDDTVTSDGRLPAASYAALERLEAAGLKVVVVTGRPAGWCDMIARFWPVAGVVGENGAFYYRYRHERRRMVRAYVRDEAKRQRDRAALMRLFAGLARRHPKIRLASDQAFRVSDIAIDICEDVKPLARREVEALVASLEGKGATVKVSSIHINAWIGDFDKLSMILAFLKKEFGLSREDARARSVYAGDSPNDEPMFRYFSHSVGVRNIERFAAEMRALPAYITKGEGGDGFRELAALLIRARRP
jgi:HAD superfamily hydrolase (TIGR01484 family)